MPDETRKNKFPQCRLHAVLVMQKNLLRDRFATRKFLMPVWRILIR